MTGQWNDDLDARFKSAGFATKTMAAALCIGVLLLAFLAWDAYGATAGFLPKAVAVFSAVAAACAISVHAKLKKIALTTWVLTSVLAAFCFPLVFSRWGTFDLKALIAPLIQLIMFGMGATLAISDFARVLTMPRAVLIGMSLQFSVMPLIGLLLARLFGFEASVAIGVILIGSCPGGVASNVMTYLAKGNVALSVTMTACSTLVAPIVTPLLMSLLAGTLVEIVFVDWISTILRIIIVPIALGIALNGGLRAIKLRGPWLDQCLSLIAMAGICFIIAIIIADSRDKLLTIGLALVAASILHNAAGYSLGYLGASLAKLDESTCRTVAMEVGLQNGGMATALAVNTLKDPLAALAPAIFGPWMNVSGSMLASWWGSRPPAIDAAAQTDGESS